MSSYDIADSFVRQGSQRLIQSFTRRLSYLHDCEEVLEIVKEWLGPSGFIGADIHNLNEYGIQILKNIDSVAPAETLAAIERVAAGPDGLRFASRDNPHFYEISTLLRHIAYDPLLFDRSIFVLKQIYLTESESENNKSVRGVLVSLFTILLSGTHSSVEQRALFIEILLDSDQQSEQRWLLAVSRG